MERERQVQPENEHLFCRARILYMDDDAGLSRLLQKRLERMAYQVDIVQDGEEGLRIFKNEVHDIVIADYNMPVVNGMEVLRRLVETVPVIILTGQGDEKIAVEAMRLGAADYILKEGNGEYLELLPSVIDRIMERQQLIRDRQRVAVELQNSEARYRAIVEDQTELICRFEPGGQMTFANAAFCKYFGIVQADITFYGLAQLMSKKSLQQIRDVLKILSPRDPAGISTQSIHTADGELHWLQWTSRAIFDDSNKAREYQLVGRDISELKAAEIALRASEQKNILILNAIPDPILRLNRQGVCVDLRVKSGQTLNLPPEPAGKNIAEIFPADVAGQIKEYIDKVFQEEASQVFQFELRRDENRIYHHEARLVLVGEDEVLAIIRDVTARAELERQMQYLSIHDGLTGLYNRLYFTEEMRRLANGRYASIGIVMCDVDGLKIVNDNLGHSKGDELLKAAANAIKHAFRSGDAIARIGGDEFAVLLPDASREVVEETCDRLSQAVAKYNETSAGLLLSISVGTALSHNVDNDALADALHQADEAMYRDKALRRAGVRQQMRLKLNLENEDSGCK